MKNIQPGVEKLHCSHRVVLILEISVQKVNKPETNGSILDGK